MQPHPQLLQSILSTLDELTEVVLDREDNLTHAHSEAREVSQVAFGAAHEGLELGERERSDKSAGRRPRCFPNRSANWTVKRHSGMMETSEK
jgi:hypothetical protein